MYRAKPHKGGAIVAECPNPPEPVRTVMELFKVCIITRAGTIMPRWT